MLKIIGWIIIVALFVTFPILLWIPVVWFALYLINR